MTHRLMRFGSYVLLMVLGVGAPIDGQSRAPVQEQQWPVVGVYFDEPLKLLEPFAAEFQRSCTCVERAFALIPRVMSDTPGSTAPLRLGDDVLRVLRASVDARWKDVSILAGGTPDPRMLITGHGIPPLDGEAAIAAGVRAYHRLARGGNAAAQTELGYLYAVGLGVPQNAEWAAYWYGQAALQGWPEATLGLAAMYAIGRGVPQDDAVAVSWLGRSQHARFLADAYACGFGVEQNFDEARRLYEVMAARDDSDAQYQLGTMYVNGCGAPLDDKVGGEWLEKAANLGHPDAQIAFAEMMNRGWARGGPDPWTAYLMAELAWTRLTDEDPSRARAAAVRDRAAATLSRDELAYVRRSVRTLLAEDAKARAETLKFRRSQVGTQK